MYTPPPDKATEPEHIARYLADPIAATWRAIDRGRAAADEFFDAAEHRTFDSHMWSQIVRYEAVLSLSNEPGPRDWQVRTYHNSGIRITKEPFKVHVCKAFAGEPQSPGRNLARREFFQQLGLLNLFSSESAANLILYWMFPHGNLELGLCKPRGLWPFKGQPKLEWRRPVSYDPLAGLSFPTTADDDLHVPLRLEGPELGEESGDDR